VGIFPWKMDIISKYGSVGHTKMYIKFTYRIERQFIQLLTDKKSPPSLNGQLGIKGVQ